jgi:hypothetical protein
VPASGVRSYRLADIQPNALVRVRYIVFDTLRDLCFGMGLREGERFRCEETGPDSIVLADAGGRAIRLNRAWARFISVSDCERQAEQPSPMRMRVQEWELRSGAPASGREGAVRNEILRTLERNRLEQEFGRL